MPGFDVEEELAATHHLHSGNTTGRSGFLFGMVCSGSSARQSGHLLQRSVASEGAFKDAITKYEFEMTAKKGWEKGKAKTLNAARDISRDEAMDPQASFMEQIGMGKGQNGKGVKNGYTMAMDKSHKVKSSLLLESTLVGAY